MLYALYLAGEFFVKILPLKACYILADILGSIYFFCAKNDKVALKENLKIILGNAAKKQDIEKYSKNVFIHFAKYLADFLKFSKINKQYLNKYVEIINSSYLDECLAKQKGIIVVTAHFGNWELGGAVIAALGHDISAIIWEHKNKKINQLFTTRRANNNIKQIPLNQIRQCFHVLKNNGILGIVGDKDYTGDLGETTLFGEKIFMPKGAAVLSLKTGAPIVACFVAREKNNKLKIFFEKPIWPDEITIPSGRSEKNNAVKKIMNSCMSMFEKYIKLYPDQWYAFEKIWKRTQITQ
ncbi:lipid A biosynthesis acyltransferase [Candidatus Omnitrophus magneticus]|uniref:Lipid A biosynthesis acyltransferase n=1 Tax=Candidatus Omnitrophus magneticus TaxID=1609969 RepID=A0A0F0CQZ8_9BACT|nr:lipid A biosynthesis acyltransferase [Candidatus Omnitrophus magneticus]